MAAPLPSTRRPPLPAEPPGTLPVPSPTGETKEDSALSHIKPPPAPFPALFPYAASEEDSMAAAAPLPVAPKHSRRRGPGAHASQRCAGSVGNAGWLGDPDEPRKRRPGSRSSCTCPSGCSLISAKRL